MFFTVKALEVRSTNDHVFIATRIRKERVMKKKKLKLKRVKHQDRFNKLMQKLLIKQLRVK